MTDTDWSKFAPTDAGFHPSRLDRFSWDDENHARVVVPQQCSKCVHRRNAETWTCDAFPKGIPGAILGNDFDHTKPYAGDHGVRFEPKPR